MAILHLSISEPARVDASALVVPFTIGPSDLQIDIDFDYPSLEIGALVIASERPRVVPFRVALPAQVDVSARVVPFTIEDIEGAALIDYDYPSFEFGVGAVIYPEVDLIEFDFPSLEMGIDMENTARRRAKMMIVQVL